ncbi:hypothetical protein N7592_06230 [Pseudomonas juntendi]|uniref:Uncharacterized protein n=3 Tax=Pseudomonas TaxID=286 RepID=A0ABX9AWN0_9PSED|nr:MULTISPECIES: hypothetical protein [Pseudomonas]AIN56996.1 hypothetical protein O165_001230 [Pseudomonas soli]KPM66992.1 hypothetical protein HB4184_01860 [Pseudomonas putida]MBH3413032.1 hypothetical protein [Pseudomonas putida]MBS3188990.1 hypothetical protein [Pseudomonas sp. PCH44]MCE0852239.1 hypothetical protein [Pseudomonas asiatica]
MRVMNTLTQNIIDSLTQLLKEPGHDTLQSLSVCAPVLIDELQQIKNNALDRRDIIPLVQSVLDEWLKEHPQPDGAIHDLQAALQKLGQPEVPPHARGDEHA